MTQTNIRLPLLSLAAAGLVALGCGNDDDDGYRHPSTSVGGSNAGGGGNSAGSQMGGSGAAAGATGGSSTARSAEIVECASATLAMSVDVQLPNFDPAEATVSAGDVIEFSNTGSTNHTTTSGAPDSPDGFWDSGTFAPSESVCVRFDTAGTYDYYCTIHPTMQGMVTVE